MSGDEKRIPTGAIAVYALPSVSMGFMSALISFYLLKFSTDVLLLAPAVMGLLFGISKVWDAISDPLAGYWSDRTRSRLGRPAAPGSWRPHCPCPWSSWGSGRRRPAWARRRSRSGWAPGSCSSTRR